MVPYKFITGSEEELRRLTTFIVHSETKFFDTSALPVSVLYCADTPGIEAHLVKIGQGNATHYPSDYSRVNPKRLHVLCNLAVRQNYFHDWEWTKQATKQDRLYMTKNVYHMDIYVERPSAHECAEAMLSLADWLEGKVSPAERLRLLGIEEV